MTASDPAASRRAHASDLGVSEANNVHDLVKALHGIGNEVRLRFLDALRLLYDGNLFHELGYASFGQYCDRELGFARSTSLEYVRVAKALDCLPRLRVLFGEGELSWEQVRSITRVATGSTETEWIELAFDEPVKQLLVEVREALRTGRDAPRDKRHGLPNLIVRLSLDMTLEEKERVRAAFELVSSRCDSELRDGPDDSVCRDSDGSIGAWIPLVRWADGILSGAIPSGPVGRGSGDGENVQHPTPAQTILYRTCPDCRETVLDTAEGPISVMPERAAELTPVANRVEIKAHDEREPEVLPNGEVDKPNTPQLARKVLSRDGFRCANPGCDRRRNLHAHHVVFRAHGGRTVLSNEVAVCDTCHALLHRGLLEATGSPDHGLIWRRRPAAAGAKIRDSAALRDRLRELGAMLTESTPHIAHGIRPDGSPPVVSTHIDARNGENGSARRMSWSQVPVPSTYVDTQQLTEDLTEDLAEGLIRLGWSRRDGIRRVRSAIEKLMMERAQDASDAGTLELPHDAAILQEALRG